MERVAESGLEVTVSTHPEVAAQPDPNNYFWSGGEESDEYGPRPRDQPIQSQVKSKARYRTMWILAVVAVVCLAMALGAGLGVGLTAQHKSRSFV